MRPAFLILFSTFFFQAIAQTPVDSVNIEPKFNNQGERESYQAKLFFQNEYAAQKLSTFNGKIIKGNNVFIFGGDSLFVHNSSPETEPLFAKGLIYPMLIGGNQISSIEELKFLVQFPQRKRYGFLLYRKGILNPVMCFFELTNDDATEKTGLVEFINGSRLTFFKQAWIMI